MRNDSATVGQILASAFFTLMAAHSGPSPPRNNGMIELIEGLPPGTVGFRVHGQVSAEDYKQVMVPDVEAAFALNRKLRLLYVTAPDFTGFDPGAMWNDAKMGARHFSGWDRVALVTDVPWLRGTATAFSFAIPAQFALFETADLDKAMDWIKAP